MAICKWINAAPYPGCQLKKDLRVIPSGAAFETDSEDEPARQFWWPVNDEARKLVEVAKARAAKLGGAFRSVRPPPPPDKNAPTMPSEKDLGF